MLAALCIDSACAGVIEKSNRSPLVSISTQPELAQATFLPVREAYPLTLEVQDTAIVMHFQVMPGYYLYGDKFSVTLHDKQQDLALPLQREKGEISFDPELKKTLEKFHRDLSITAALPAAYAPPHATITVSFQGCADAGLCYATERIQFDVDRERHRAQEIQPTHPGLDATAGHASTSTGWMLLFAFIGGLILNLMPCVFPVLSIKLLSFAHANRSDSHLREHSWCYSLGVLTTFLLTGALLMMLRQHHNALGWGYQLQSPWFVGALALLFLVLALSMSGFITLGTRLMGVGQHLTEGQHYRHSFFTGVLAVLVASPCSVPFMGVALGFALTQPPLAALLIFAGLGLGLAAPFLFFAYAPWLIEHLPKPGPWMETLKHWLALPLYASAIWLVWVLSHQLLPHTADADAFIEPYSATRLSKYLDQQEPVFIELTADWCLTCLANEKAALSRPAVRDAMQQRGIHYLRGDWTNGDAEITALLKQHQRAGVPLYLYYHRDGKASILPQLLTEKIVLEAVRD